jgi:hypothetical protein
LDKPSRAILFVYAVVLFSSLGLTPLWLDEVIQGIITLHGSAREMMLGVQVNAGASPLPYLAQHVFMGWFGNSAWVARFPAALCSVLCGVVFAAICPYFLKTGRWIALILFLALPIQFRYGLEARVYSQGLLFSLLALLLFLKLNERFSPELTVIYAFAVAAGLYSQPLTLFPTLAQMLPASRPARIAAATGLLFYLPWYFAQHQAQARYALIVPPTTFFSMHQLNPLTLLHDITGGGYFCAVPLLALVAWAIGRARGQRLLLYTVAAALIGPILMDVVFNYFFAERQLLFAMPALILLAGQGLERLRAERPGVLGWAMIAVFLLAATVKNYRQATRPRDDLAATADAIVAHLRPGACVLSAPLEHIAVYSFFHPELERRACPGSLDAPEVVAVINGYTSAAERKNLADSVHHLNEQETFRIGQSEMFVYKRE